METILAKWFHVGRLKPVRLLVLHETISPESGTGAEAVARYFAAGERRASTHRVADCNSTVRCVADKDTAFGAAGANSDGLHMELVGPGNQSEKSWMDPFSKATILEAGKSIREWSTEFDIPLRWLTVAEVANGRTKGLCTHDDVSKAFPAVSTGHSDPANFPKAWALNLWLPTAPPPPKPIEPEDAEMTFVNVTDSGRYYMVTAEKITALTDAEAKSLITGGWAPRKMTLAIWNKVT